MEEIDHYPDETYPFESALCELIDKIDPDLDSGDIFKDAYDASEKLDRMIEEYQAMKKLKNFWESAFYEKEPGIQELVARFIRWQEGKPFMLNSLEAKKMLEAVLMPERLSTETA